MVLLISLNGLGQSAPLQLLIGLLSTDQGTITVMGHYIQRHSAAR
ncbi:hypothetical protein ACVC7V_16675 [Hydrogenophaga sp. A37]|nr:hypothetical protein [Hydrogenophaga sp. A37]